MWWIVRKRKDLRRRRWGGGGKAFWETFDLDQGKVAEHDLFGSDSYTTKEQEKQRILRNCNQDVRQYVLNRRRSEGEDGHRPYGTPYEFLFRQPHAEARG
jgi:hypothetical protein